MKQSALELAYEIKESLKFQEKRYNLDLPARVFIGVNKLRIEELIEVLNEMNKDLNELKFILKAIK